MSARQTGMSDREKIKIVQQNARVSSQPTVIINPPDGMPMSEIKSMEDNGNDKTDQQIKTS